MRHGADWYKRYPTKYLGGVQGMSAKEHAVFSVIIELIYQHGGEVNDDPSWIAGWISDMGSAAVRKAISALVDSGKLTREGGRLSNGFAKSEAKTKQNLSETRAKHGRKGGKAQRKNRVADNENNDLGQANAPPREDKRREEYSVPNGTDGQAVDFTKAVFDRGVAFLGKYGTPERNARSLIGRWRKEAGDEAVFNALSAANREGVTEPVAWITASLTTKSNCDLDDIFQRAKAEGKIS